MLSEPQLTEGDASWMASSFMCQALGMKDRLSWNIDQSTPRWPLQHSNLGAVSLLHGDQGFHINALSKQGESRIAFYDLNLEVT